MFLKVKFRCNCGCVSEYDGSTTADHIYCPSCGNSLPDEDSTKVLTALKSVNSLPEKYDEFPMPTLRFSTDQLESFLGNQKET